MGISTTQASSKIYSNSPRPLVWMGYGLVFQIASFHKLKLDGYGSECVVVVLGTMVEVG